MTTTPDTVRRWHAATIPLATALADTGELFGTLTFLASTPARYVVDIYDPHGDIPAGLGRCFELRAFTPAGELRWGRPYGAEAGTAELLIPDCHHPAPDAARWTEQAPLTPIARISLRHILWGIVVRSAHGRCVLAEDRVHDIALPIDAPIGSRVSLIGEELVIAGVDGNAMIAAERLIGFERMGADDDPH